MLNNANPEAPRAMTGDLVFQVKLGSCTLADVLNMLSKSTADSFPGGTTDNDAKVGQICMDTKVVGNGGTGENPDSDTPSRKAELQSIRQQVVDIRDAIKNAKSENDVHGALNAMGILLDNIKNDADLDTYVSNFQGVLNGVRMHNNTCKELDDMLGTFLTVLDDDLIYAEEKHERVEMLKRLFQQLAENAESLTELLDINAIFG